MTGVQTCALPIFLAVSGSWVGFVVAPNFQLSTLQETNTIGAGVTYPLGRPGLAQQGLQVYRANGCVSCHSQMVVQERTMCEVSLTDFGTNFVAVESALRGINSNYNAQVINELKKSLPKTIVFDTTKQKADATVKLINQAGAKAQVVVTPSGSDIARGWGRRRSVAEDYLYDDPVMLGGLRVGPDLANLGSRLPDVNWHLRHLYAPQTEIASSTMPPYRFLFETRKIGSVPVAEPLNLPSGLVPTGYEVVPKPEAVALAQYLVSLRADVQLYSTPFSTPPAASGSGSGISSNAPAVK